MFRLFFISLVVFSLAGRKDWTCCKCCDGQVVFSGSGRCSPCDGKIDSTFPYAITGVPRPTTGTKEQKGAKMAGTCGESFAKSSITSNSEFKKNTCGAGGSADGSSSSSASTASASTGTSAGRKKKQPTCCKCCDGAVAFSGTGGCSKCRGEIDSTFPYALTGVPPPTTGSRKQKGEKMAVACRESFGKPSITSNAKFAKKTCAAGGSAGGGAAAVPPKCCQCCEGRPEAKYFYSPDGSCKECRKTRIMVGASAIPGEPTDVATCKSTFKSWPSKDPSFDNKGRFECSSAESADSAESAEWVEEQISTSFWGNVSEINLRVAFVLVSILLAVTAYQYRSKSDIIEVDYTELVEQDA